MKKGVGFRTTYSYISSSSSSITFPKAYRSTLATTLFVVE